MQSLRNVLVATDFGAAADTALAFGRSLAAMAGARLHLLHVIEHVHTGPMVLDPHQAMSAANARLEACLARKARQGPPARAVTRISARPADAIVDYARRHQIDLIVTGTHGRNGMNLMMMGSVAAQVVRMASCPVLTVKYRTRISEAEGLMLTLKNILVATDFGEASDVALTYGRTLARTLGATLHVLHVTEPVSFNVFGAESYTALAPELQHDVDGAARRQLDEVLMDNDKREPPTKGVLLTSSAPSLAIAEYAKDQSIDLIVMGTHGRGGLAHMVMGSVAERVVRIARCPVLTVHHPGRDFVLPEPPAAQARA